MKKIRPPKDFGRKITGNLFEETGGSIYGYVRAICEAAGEDKPEADETFKKVSKCISDPELQKIFRHMWKLELPQWYINFCLTVGFALGQRIDIPTPEAQKEIDFVWDTLKKEKGFFIYPRKDTTTAAIAKSGQIAKLPAIIQLDGERTLFITETGLSGRRWRSFHHSLDREKAKGKGATPAGRARKGTVKP